MKRVRSRWQMKKNKGFSLVELVVTVLILGILAVAVTPQIMSWIEKTKVAKDTAYAGEIAAVAEAVALEHLIEGDLGDAVLTYHVSKNQLTLPDGSTTSLSEEVKSMIGESKCIKPTQKGKTYFELTITPNTGGTSVTATAKAMP